MVEARGRPRGAMRASWVLALLATATHATLITHDVDGRVTNIASTTRKH